MSIEEYDWREVTPRGLPRWVHKGLERDAWSKLIVCRRGLFRVCNGDVVFNTTGFYAYDFSVLRPLKHYFITFLL